MIKPHLSTISALSLVLTLIGCGSDGNPEGSQASGTVPANAPAPGARGGSMSSAGTTSGIGAGGAGGAFSSGGAESIGGTNATGGTAMGRDGASGGTPATTRGGQPNSGGTTSGGAASGGQPNSGGTASGGAASGGQPGSGGTASGGAVNEGGTSAAGAPGEVDPKNCNAAATIQQYAPADSRLLKDFTKYVSTYIGSLQCSGQAPAGESRTIKQPIFVPPGVTYDGKGEKLTADAGAMNCDLSDGEQGENQRPYFLLAPGATLKNVTINYPGCDGVHMMGDNVLDNISWPNVGEDAASVRSYFPGGDILIQDSDAKSASDKMFQFNAECKVRIENFKGADMGKLVRQNGDATFPLQIDLNNVDVTGVISAVVQSDSPLCTVRHHNLTYKFVGSGDKSDRVFRDMSPSNVTEY